MNDYDVLIIGLGPAGGSAALRAASGGLKVLAIDKRAQIGFPVQCAEYIPGPLAQFRSSIPHKIIDGMCNFIQDDYVSKQNNKGFMISRSNLDAYLAQQARNKGAEVMTATALKSLRRQDKIAEICRGENHRKIVYKTLIAADGPRSRVAGLLGLPKQNYVFAQQYVINSDYSPSQTEVYLDKRYLGGYAWLFPTSTGYNLGVGMTESGVALKSALDFFFNKMQLRSNTGWQISGITGGLIPVSGMRTRLDYGNIIFCGDAAGLTHPISGAGIAAAIESGQSAGDAVIEYLGGNLNAFGQYSQEIRLCYGNSLQHGIKKRMSMMKLWHNLNGIELFSRHWVGFKGYYS